MGMVLGAALVGRLADIKSRRLILSAFVLLLGLFSIATTTVWNFHVLCVMRLITGLGIGGLVPVLISMAAESAMPQFRSTAISMLMGSGGLGALFASAVAFHSDWRMIFYVGGIGPLMAVPIVMSLNLGGSAREQVGGSPSMTMGQILFGTERVAGTLLIWTISFWTVLTSYALVNWLPSLLLKQGFSLFEMHVAMLLYSTGGIVGNIVSGRLVDRGRPRIAYAIMYLGAAACLAGLALIPVAAVMYALSFAINFCILGAQLVTIALTSTYYPKEGRSTGIGAMISVGRTGSVVGPLAVGLLLHAGLRSNQLFLLLIPVVGGALALAMKFVVQRGLRYRHEAMLANSVAER
jgi:AAHS family 3-hydroxyphenylpropionic acid transporter